MTSDRRRVQGSAAVSLSFHILVLGLYALLSTAPSRSGLLLAKVELMDIRTEPGPAAAELPAARRAPRSVKDFLKMALPRLREETPAAQPQDLASPRPERLPTLDWKPQKILVDKGTLTSRAPLSLKAARPSAAAARLSEMTAPGAAPQAPRDLTDVTAPTLTLEAVGRKAAGEPGAGAIRIDAGAAARTSQLADLARPAALRPAGAGPQTGTEGISLMDEGPGRGPAAMPKGRLPLAYGRDSGGGISLREQPIARAPVLAPEPAIAAPAPAAAPGLKPPAKAVEITGPLAQRQILGYELPRYPDWARDRNIEAEVMIRFFVSSDGRVRDRLIIERTSGHPQLDQLCMKALKRWVFAALPAEGGDQWGVIMFRFRLK